MVTSTYGKVDVRMGLIYIYQQPTTEFPALSVRLGVGLGTPLLIALMVIVILIIISSAYFRDFNKWKEFGNDRQTLTDFPCTQHSRGTLFVVL